LTIEGRKTAKVDGGYDGGKYIKKVNNLAIPCYSWWRGKDLNLRPSGYEFYVPPYYWLISTYINWYYLYNNSTLCKNQLLFSYTNL